VSNPDFFTVVEAARVLRIGRTAAYEQSKVYRATGGASGLPVVQIGRKLLVPRHQLELLAGGPLSEPEQPPRRERKPRTRRVAEGLQPGLPFAEAG
jgi:hypothetical protein